MKEAIKIRRAFCDQRSQARKRVDKHGNPIQFLLSFEEWLSIWQASGHFHERGCKKGQYVMSRYNDIGNYEVGNVFIQQQDGNHKDAQPWKFSPRTKFKKHKDLEIL